MTKTIGVIAGNGCFPLLVAREARVQGYRVVVCAILREADESIEKQADACRWVKVGELKKLVDFFQKENVTEALMAGKVEKVRLFQENVSPDFEMIKVLMKTRDFKDDSLLAGIADFLAGKGIQLLDSTIFLKDHLPGPGVQGRHKPSKAVMEDIRFGFQMAKSIAGLDIGQTVVVKKKAVMAVEAIEGTDHAIRRGGELGGGKVTVVKVAKPNQDMRFDVPTVGLHTMKELIAAQAEAFAYEAGKTIIMDREDFIDRANQKGIVLMGVDSAS
ncbi:MAG: UDP-2,3-diacylglucosamine diphosphatase LpxI [Candidatus Omnitrophica bacterium]|nr:UDP-2,3-diacylglucosamine diphosphatase LpxI [Candidatus Omnitrophota bacterium]MDD5671645.1 UDP-2,3-diacylglucosamine diphosphatase LpxI [Candidatus Omnitrophota bacterium]